jgi:ribokinase
VGTPEITAAASAPAPGEALVISAEIPVAAIRAALALDGPGLRILNLAPAPSSPRELLAGVDWLVVNQSEAASVLGRPVEDLAGSATAAAELAGLGSCHAVVTAGADGAAYCPPPATAGNPGAGDPGEAVTVPGFRVHAVDSVGAGDTFVGALAVTLAAGIPPEDAVRAACAAGAAAASRPGTQSGMPRASEIRAATGFSWPLAPTAAPAEIPRKRA